MQRMHLFEIMDQPWCPAFLRNAMTDYLQASVALNNPYTGIVELLARALTQAGTHSIIDLCAGAGGPWRQLHPALEAAMGKRVVVALTDQYPNPDALAHEAQALASVVRYPASVDARRVPPELRGFRTIFAGLHHFPPAEAQAILRDAVAQRQGIGVFEVTERRPLALALTLLVPMLVLLITPTIRPFRWSRLFWTYLLPLVPLAAWFDGIVSCLRTYTPAELQAMTTAIGAADYHWEIGTLPIGSSPLNLIYLIGYPGT